MILHRASYSLRILHIPFVVLVRELADGGSGEILPDLLDILGRYTERADTYIF